MGKHIEAFSRIAEQEEFIDQLVDIANKNRVDLIIIAGDIFDTSNPPAAAEALFYNSLSRLSDNNRRVILIIAGNHDSPERLTASSPLSAELNIILLGTPKSAAHTKKGGAVKDAGEGFVEVDINGERAVILTMPYPSEKTLNEIIFSSGDEKDNQSTYSQLIAKTFHSLAERFRSDTINLVAGHFYVMGGETVKSERNIQVGGNYAVELSALPSSAQYVALGHLHRCQSLSETVHYCGAPIQYDRSEATHAKSVNLVTLSAGETAVVEKIFLKNYKPIEVWKAGSIEEALSLCESRSNDAWVYLDIVTDRALLQSELKQMLRLKSGIVAINVTPTSEVTSEEESEVSVMEAFEQFYSESRGVQPTKQLMELFASFCKEMEAAQ